MRSDDALRRRARFAEFARAADVVPENPDYAKITEQLSKTKQNPEFDRLMKAQVQRCNMLNAAFQLNGPSLYVDKYLRKFLLEYNNRVFKGRGNEQPTSFNIDRAFVTPDEKAFVLKLLDEKFFQFNLLDYLDFVTSNAVGDSSIAVDEFDELTIYELNAGGSFAQVVLPGFEDLVFCGAAIAREGTEFSIMAIFGNRRSLFVEGSQLMPEQIRPQKREFIGEGPWDLSAERLFDSDSYYPLIAMTRIDLSDRLIHAQYIMHESKDIFRVTTDDPDVILEPTFYQPGVDMDAIIKTALTELSRYSHVFNLLHNLLHFPKFFQRHEDDFYVERHPTQLKLSSQTTRMRKLRATLEAKYLPNYREVLTLRQSDDLQSSLLNRMDLKFETSGYWRTLQSNQLGADKLGNPIHGKTWVEERLSWREVENVDADRDKQTSVVRISRTDDIGYVYIMRSPVHERNIYKVGFTKRDPEVRANDLSATSGQPDALVVMQSWKVFEPRRVEQEIHHELELQRINSRREFFKANFEMLRKTIESIIARLDAVAM